MAAPGQKLSRTLVSLLRQLTRICPALGIAVLLAAAFLADARHPAAAQGRLEAEYVATLMGIPIGRGNWIIDISEDEFTAAANGATAGLLRFFASGTGVSATRGTIAAGTRLPSERELAQRLGISRSTVADLRRHGDDQRPNR